MFSEPGFNINFDDVPVGKITEVDKIFDEVISGIIDKGPEEFELKLVNVISEKFSNSSPSIFCFIHQSLMNIKSTGPSNLTK